MGIRRPHNPHGLAWLNGARPWFGAPVVNEARFVDRNPRSRSHRPLAYTGHREGNADRSCCNPHSKTLVRTLSTAFPSWIVGSVPMRTHALPQSVGSRLDGRAGEGTSAVPDARGPYGKFRSFAVEGLAKYAAGNPARESDPTSFVATIYE